MPYVKKTAQFSNFRCLISGFSNTGKTTSLPTFIYGPYDYKDPEQESDAFEYASGKSMVIISCPGEVGVRSLPIDSPHITSYYPEMVDGVETNGYEWSSQALDDLYNLEKEVVKNKPDILVYDGVHGLALHSMNAITHGDFLTGVDLDIHPITGNVQQFRRAGFYDKLWNMFGQHMAAIYNKSVPLVIVTCWEDWKGAKTDSEKPGGAEATRYLWPDLPGKLATRVVGMFDARISARTERRCLHSDCDDAKENVEHFVWQFLPRNDVVAVGIKGLKVNKAMKKTPWIHQNWDDLKGLIEGYS